MRRMPSLFRLTSAGMLVLVVAACTPGGQFDPTTLLDKDMFDTKKKLQGDREPVFPGGVPGTTTGVPPDLVKGYQPPPEQTDAAAADAAAQQAQPAEKPKPKPKPKLAGAACGGFTGAGPANGRPGRPSRPIAIGLAGTAANRASSAATAVAVGLAEPAGNGFPLGRGAATRSVVTSDAARHHDLYRHHRWPPECRQIDAVQPAGAPAPGAG